MGAHKAPRGNCHSKRCHLVNEISYLRRSPTGLQRRRNRTLVVRIKLENRLKAQAGFCPPGFRKEFLEDNIWFVTQPCESRGTQGSISHHPSGGPLN